MADGVRRKGLRQLVLPEANSPEAAAEGLPHTTTMTLEHLLQWSGRWAHERCEKGNPAARRASKATGLSTGR
jgi:hypothetical protein